MSPDLAKVVYVGIALLVAVAGGLAAVAVRRRDGHSGFWLWTTGAWVFVIVGFIGLLFFSSVDLL
ncbi:hypothetical protein AB0A63_24490 [Lentzea sp. NPDC042327]|uniref:hypothetical protein n=1 Tax=Lentzea sp. NPDC042327 TaxID=3154801 RepID=UPI0033DBB60E